MSFNKKQLSGVRQKVDSSNRLVTDVLDATTTSEIIKLGQVAEKVSFQSDGDLAGNVSFSINGKDFFSSTAFTATTPGSYSTHSVLHVKVDRTGGSGKLYLVYR